MRGSLFSSVLLHAAVLGWALISIQAQPELRVSEPEPIAVDLVTQGDLTKLKKGVRTAKQLEAEAKPDVKADVAKKEAPKPTPVAAAPPPPAPKEEASNPEQPPEKPPEPKPPERRAEPEKVASAPPPAASPPPPVPAPEEQKQLEDLLKQEERNVEQQRLEEEARKAQEQKRIEEERRQEEERKQAELKKREAERKREAEKKRKEAELKKKREEAKKREFDASKIAALLNKTPDKGAPVASPEPPEQPTTNKGPVLGAPEGRDRQLSASELAVLRQIISACVKEKWNVLAGGQSAQGAIVKLRMRFNPDGTLAAAPVIMNPQSTPYFLAISDSAVRAVQACEPYPLPPNSYEFWKDIVMNFDPRDMF